jgi:hypothetical protein
VRPVRMWTFLIFLMISAGSMVFYGYLLRVRRLIAQGHKRKVAHSVLFFI